MVRVRLGSSLDIDDTDPVAIAHAYLEAGLLSAICPPVTLDQPERIKNIRIPGEVPLKLEHLPQEEYPLARDYMVGVAKRVGVSIHDPSARDR